MGVVFVILQFLLGTKGLFANVARILIFRILIHCQTSTGAVSVRISNPDLTNEMSKRKRMFVTFLGLFRGEEAAKRALSIGPSHQTAESVRA
jgi:hypothetical protein